MYIYIILPTPPKSTLKRGKSPTSQGQVIYLYTPKNNPEYVFTGSSVSLSICLCVRIRCVCTTFHNLQHLLMEKDHISYYSLSTDQLVLSKPP